jgi:flagellin
LIITVGSAAAVTIALAGTDKMGDVVSRINASTAAVTASITDDGYLKLTGKNQGEAITLSDSTSGATLAALGVSAGPHNATGQTDHSLLEIDSIATARAKNGADQNVLQYYSELATASKTNFESAVSRIMDVDVAQESTQLARWNTLVQAGTAMMAQANGSTLSALSLLKG